MYKIESYGGVEHCFIDSHAHKCTAPSNPHMEILKVIITSTNTGKHH